MSTKTLYYCDLCREEKLLGDLIAFEFGLMGGNEIIKKSAQPPTCARHYCKKCVEEMYQFLSEIRKTSK